MDTHPSHHPTSETLQAYGLGKLDDASAEAVNKHLEDCPDCRRQVAEMAPDSFLARLREAQEVPVTADVLLMPRTARRRTSADTQPETTVVDDATVDHSPPPYMSSDGPRRGDIRCPNGRERPCPSTRHLHRLLRRLRAAESAGRRGHGDRLQGPPAQPERPGGLEDDPGRPVRLGRRGPPVPERGRGRRPARPPPHRADLRGRPVRRPALFQHEADRGREPRQAAEGLRRRPSPRGPAGGDRRRRGPPRPPARHPPPRPEAGEHPGRFRRSTLTSPTSAWPSGSKATAS